MIKEDKGEEIKRRDETTKNGPPPRSRKYILYTFHGVGV
jgi:hypothetical protein